jgi:hypothetical protein
MLLRCLIAFSHIVAAAQAPDTSGAATGAPTTEPIAAEEQRNEQAKQMYADQRFRDSAHAFEALHREFAGAKYLFNAAAAREAAGDDAHAYVLLQRYIAEPGLSAEQRAQGEARVAPLRSRTTAIRLEIVPRPTGLVLSLRCGDGEVLRLDDEALAVLDREGVTQLWAEPCTWTVEAAAPQYRGAKVPLEATVDAVTVFELELEPEPAPVAAAPEPAVGQVTVKIVTGRRGLPKGLRLRARRAGTEVERPVTGVATTWELPAGGWSVSALSRNFEAGPVPVELVRETRQEVSLKLRRTPRSRAAIGLGISAGALIGAGAGMMVAGYGEWKPNQFEGNERPGSTGYQLDFIGASALGTGLGLGIGAAGLAIERKMRRPQAMWGPLAALGVASVVVGALTVRYPVGAVSETLTIPGPEESGRWTPSPRVHEARALSVLLGVGAGLLLSSTIRGLISLRNRSRNDHIHR